VADNSEKHQRTYRDTQVVILEQRYEDKSESIRKRPILKVTFDVRLFPSEHILGPEEFGRLFRLL
jgi:hypothetical protein